jgi:hypothetical protein
LIHEIPSLLAAANFWIDRASWQTGAHHGHFLGVGRKRAAIIEAEALRLLLAAFRDMNAVQSTIAANAANFVWIFVWIVLGDSFATRALVLKAAANTLILHSETFGILRDETTNVAQ